MCQFNLIIVQQPWLYEDQVRVRPEGGQIHLRIVCMPRREPYRNDMVKINIKSMLLSLSIMAIVKHTKKVLILQCR